MSLDLKRKDCHWYVDENWVMREKSDADDNKHDSCETTYHAQCAYHEWLFWLTAKNCLGFEGTPQRYPKKYAGMQPMSRDHCIYSLCNLMENGIEIDVLKMYIPPIIFDKGAGSYMNLQMWLWTKLITEKKIGYLFYPVALINAVKNSTWNRVLEGIFNYHDLECSIDYHNLHTDAAYNKKIASLYYPVYAIKLVATMLQYVPKNWFRKQIKRQLLKITPDENYAIKIMLGDKRVTEKQVKSFRPINKPRWSQMINPYRNNTKFRYLTDAECEVNCVDRDYLLYLWNNRENFYE